MPPGAVPSWGVRPALVVCPSAWLRACAERRWGDPGSAPGPRLWAMSVARAPLRANDPAPGVALRAHLCGGAARLPSRQSPSDAFGGRRARSTRSSQGCA
eukprot:3098030-Alexandrium_andersonii.AAC.1